MNLSKQNFFLIICIFIISLTCISTVSAGNTADLTTDAYGEVSGGVDLSTSNPWIGGYSELSYNLPSGVSAEDVQYAGVYTNVYLGSGSNSNYRADSVVKFDGGNGSSEVIGNEYLYTDEVSTDGTFRVINNHTGRVYSDAQSFYNVTGLITGTNLKVSINTTAHEGYENCFDGRVKLLGLLITYDDGDNDIINYWVNSGNAWTNGITLTTMFDTTSISLSSSSISDAELYNIGLSSSNGNYSFNGNMLNNENVSSGSYYQRNQWNVTDFILLNQTNVLNSTPNTGWAGSPSLKNSLAVLKLYKVNSVDGGKITVKSRGDTTYSSISTAISAAADGDIIYIGAGVYNNTNSGSNDLHSSEKNTNLVLGKSLTIVGAGQNLTFINGSKTDDLFNLGEAVTISFLNLTFVDFINTIVFSNSSNDQEITTTVKIENCSFINNTLGIYDYTEEEAFDNDVVHINNCTFVNTGICIEKQMCDFGSIGVYNSIFVNSGINFNIGGGSETIINVWYGKISFDISSVDNINENDEVILKIVDNKDNEFTYENAAKLPQNVRVYLNSTGTSDDDVLYMNNGVASNNFNFTKNGKNNISGDIYGLTNTVNFVIYPIGICYVNYINGNDENSGIDKDNAVKTIEKSLNLIVNNGVIYLGVGTYYLNESTGVNGISITKNISIIGESKNDVIINGVGAGRIFYLNNSLNVRFVNLTFINGNSSSSSFKPGYGGVIYANKSIVSFIDSNFLNNTAGSSNGYGGAIYSINTNLTVINSTFENNSAYYNAGAIYLSNDICNLTVNNSIFQTNCVFASFGMGGAISGYGLMNVSSSVFYNNYAPQNGNSIHSFTDNLNLSYSILVSNKTGTEVYIQNPSVSVVENNWWGNNITTNNDNPTTGGFTNINVNNWLIFNLTTNQTNVSQKDNFIVTVDIIYNQSGNSIDKTLIFENIPVIVLYGKNIVKGNLTNGIFSTNLNAGNTIGNETISATIYGTSIVRGINVLEKILDIDIKIKTSSNFVYAGVNNTLNVTIENKESFDVSNVTVELYSNETNSILANYSIDSLNSGKTVIYLVDPTIRPITENTVWGNNNTPITYTIVLKYNGNKLVNASLANRLILYNGYLNQSYAYNGSSNIVSRNYTIDGDIIVSTQDVSQYKDQFNRHRNETWNISVPEGSNLVAALLYFNYNWDTSYFPNGWTLSFNGNNITSEFLGHYTDQGNLGGWGAYKYGLLSFDVTPYFVNGNNNFEINKTLNCALYPSTLVLLYNTTGSNVVKKVYLADCCDVFYPYYTMDYENETDVIFNFDNISVVNDTHFNLFDATWYVFAGSAESSSRFSDLELLFNDNKFNGTWIGASNGCSAAIVNVTKVICENNLGHLVTPSNGTTVVAYEQILVLSSEKVSITPKVIVKINDTSINFRDIIEFSAFIYDNGFPISSGQVEFFVNNVSIGLVNVVNGIAKQSWTVNLSKGSYVLTAKYYSSTEEYLSNDCNLSFKIIGNTLISTVLFIEDFNAYINEDISLIFNVSDEFGNVVNTGIVSLYIGDKFIGYHSVNNGSVVFNLSTCNESGNYAIRGYYTSSDGVYNSSNVNATLILKEKEIVSVFIANNFTTVVGSNDNFTATLTDINKIPISNQTVILTLTNSKGITIKYLLVTDELGVANLPINLISGNYSISGVFAGYGKYCSSNFSNVNLVVKSIYSNSTSWIVYNATFFTKSGENFTAKLVDAFGNPLVGNEVSFNLTNALGESRVYWATTNTEGVAKLPISLAYPANYTIVAKFAGNGSYEASSSETATISIVTNNTILTADNMITTTLSGKNFTATLKDNKNSFISGREISLTLYNVLGESKVYWATTNTEGVAKLPINLAYPSTYYILVNFPGNNNTKCSNIVNATLIIYTLNP